MWRIWKDVHNPSSVEGFFFIFNKCSFPRVNYTEESLICRIRTKWIRRWARLIKVFSRSHYTSYFLIRTLLSATSFKHQLSSLSAPSWEPAIPADPNGSKKMLSMATTGMRGRTSWLKTYGFCSWNAVMQGGITRSTRSFPVFLSHIQWSCRVCSHVRKLKKTADSGVEDWCFVPQSPAAEGLLQPCPPVSTAHICGLFPKVSLIFARMQTSLC